VLQSRLHEELESRVQERTAQLTEANVALQAEFAWWRAEQARNAAEAEKQVAIFQERERAAQEQVAELAKANAALKQMLDVLVTESDLNNFLGQVLKVIAKQFDAPLTEYWFHPEPGNIAYLGLSCWNGQILTPAEQPEHPGVVGFPVPPELIHNESLHRRQGHFVIEDLGTDPLHVQISSQIGVDIGAWYTARSVRRHINVPLVLGDKSIGALLVFLPGDRHFTNEQIELAYALAQEVTLAIHLTQLTEQAKQAAIATGQEKAAQERAAELAKVNEALRRSASGLATITNIEDILTIFLSEAIAVAGASAGAVLRRVGKTEFEFVAILQDAELLRGKPLQNHPFSIAVRERSRHDETGYFARIARGLTVWRLAQDGTDWLPEAAQYHRAHGQQALWDIPFSIGNEVAGYLGLAFRTADGPSAVVTEAIAALANQVAVALELTRLAEEAKQTAIAREQEKAATERADELAKANDALKQSLDVLATEPALDKFLGHVLREIAQQFQSPLTEYCYHPEETAYIGLLNWQGRLLDREAIAQTFPTHPGLGGFQVPPELIGCESLQQRRQHLIYDSGANPLVNQLDWVANELVDFSGNRATI